MDPRILAKRKMRKEKNRLERVKLAQNLTLFVLFIFLVYFIINSYVFTVIKVEGRSMYPTFDSGDKLLFSKINIRAESLDRGSVVVFKDGDSNRYIKRIVGLPGEYVEIRNGKIFINGELLKEEYNSQHTYKYNVDSWYLKDDEFFVLGDNRRQNDSKDSRIFGPINIKRIDGKFMFKL